MLILGQKTPAGFDAYCECGKTICVLSQAELQELLTGKFGEVKCFECEGANKNEIISDILYLPGDACWSIDGRIVRIPFSRIGEVSDRTVHITG